MRKSKWFKLVSMLVAAVLVMNSPAVVPVLAIAPMLPDTSTVYCETNEITAGSTAEIPILISDNSGIAGFGIYISYDPNVLTPISVTDAGGIIPGKTQNSIGGNLPNIPENTIKVMCSGYSNFTADGLLFTVKFAVDPNASGSTVLHLSYDIDDTIDEDINEVALLCRDITLSINNAGLDLLPQIELTAEKAPAYHQIVLHGILKEPKDLSSAQMVLQYNSSAFSYTSASSAATISGITETAGKLSFTLSNINALEKGTDLFEVVLTLSDSATAGQYEFTGSATSVVGASEVHFTNCFFEVTEDSSKMADVSSVGGLSNNQGHVVSVPIMIQNNPGLMGYKLSFSFDGNDISPIRTLNSLLFSTGSFGDNIGLKANQFDVLWNGIDACDENGQVFLVEFEVLTGDEKDTTVTVSYSQPDTYDGDYQDVLLRCSNIVIALNSYTEVRDAKEATCCETGYTGDTYCKECGEKLASGTVVPATGNHTDADGKWESNGTLHWHTCYYGTQFDVASHTGGTATCTEKAKCSVCGVEYGDYGAHGETEIRNAKEPTCCEDGYTGDTYCKDCNTKIASGSVILATGHHTDADGKWETNGTQHWHTCYYGTQFDLASHTGGTATCSEKAKCSVCGAEYGDYAEHTLTHHGRVDPDYENDGNIEYWTCDDCGKYFEDANGHNEISADDIIINKLTVTEYQFLDGEVTIEAPDGAIPDGSIFDVQKIVPPPAEVVEKVKDQMGSSSEVIAYYEIRLSDTDGMLIIHLDGEITIKIQMPAQYVGSNCVRVLQEDETGKLITMTSWWEGEYLCYKTDWLEIYAEP